MGVGPLTQAEGEGNRGSPGPRSGLVFVFFTGSKQTNRKKANQCLRKGAPPALARFCGSLRRALLQSACSPPSGGTCRRRSDSLLGATHGRGLCTDLPEVGWSLPYPGHCPSPQPPLPAGRTQKEPVLAGPTSFASFPVTSAIWHCANLLGLTLPSRAVVPRAVPEILLVLQREPGLSQVL